MPTYTTAKRSGTTVLVTISVTHRRPGRITRAIHPTVAIRLTIENTCSGVTVHLSCHDHSAIASSGPPRRRKPPADRAEYRPEQEHSDRHAIGLDKRLSAQRLTQQDGKQRDVACNRDEHHANACGLIRPAAAHGEREERQDLHGMQADEMRNSHVAILNAPSGAG